MSDHTPGPWFIMEPSPTSGWGKCVGGGTVGKRRIVARLPGRNQQLKSADARLIAAAPDLLGALKNINDATCYASEEATETSEAALLMIGQLARAAIARAEGEA